VNISELDAGKLAFAIECDGTLCIAAGQVRVEIRGKDHGVIKHFEKVTGKKATLGKGWETKTCREENGKGKARKSGPMCRWDIRDYAAGEFLEKIIPQLQGKKSQARWLLRFNRMKQMRPTMTADAYREKVRFYKKVSSAFNHKTYRERRAARAFA